MTTAAGAVAPWRFAARLARREVQRRPWRTVLVALLVALPVAGMTIASVLTRTEHVSTWLERQYGEGIDMVVTRPADTELDLDTVLPPGSSARTIDRVTVGVETADGTIVSWLQLLDSGRFGEGASLSTTEGRPPATGDVWLTSALADDFDVDVGDTLALAHPAGTWAVAGIGESRAGSDNRLMVMPDLPVTQFRDGIVEHVTMLNLPDDLTTRQVDLIGQTIRGAASPADAVPGELPAWADWDVGGSAPDVAPLAWTWVVGTIALAATGIIVAAAFATSARRQLATIGILAANGSSERWTRRALAAQGAWTGAVGSVVGVALGVAALVLGRSVFERINGADLGEYRFGAVYLAGIALTGVVAATTAALVPARTASKVPVMAALAGRRPLGKIPPRLVPRGVGIAVLGGLLLVLGARSRDGGAVPTIAAILGAVFVLAGMCCCSPLAVDGMGRVCGRLRGPWRLAGRELGRTRTRSAAVVTAIAVIGALATAGSAVVVADTGSGGWLRPLPGDAVLLLPERDQPARPGAVFDLEAERSRLVPASTINTIDAIVPTAQWHPRRVATWDPAPFAEADDPWAQGVWWQFVVADEATMELYELSPADREVLAATGVLVISAWWFTEVDPAVSQPSLASRASRLRVPVETGDVTLDIAVREEVRQALADGDDDLPGIDGADQFLITEEAATAAGFDIVESGAFLRSDATLTDAQRGAVQDAVYGTLASLGDYYVDLPRIEASDAARWSIALDWQDDSTPEVAIQALLAAVAFVLTLLVVAIGLALAAAEGAAERDVLVAIGGRPATLRTMAAVRAVALTATGLVLAVPFGLLPTFAVWRASGTPFAVPWLAIGILVLAVPPLAGAIAWLVSAVAQRVKPVRISALAFD